MEMQKSFFTALEMAVINAGGPAKFSKMTGESIPNITRWLKQERLPGFDSVMKLVSYIDWPPAPTMKRIGQNAPVDVVKGDSLPTIPVFLEAGAGNAIELWRTEPSRTISVLPQYYRKDVRAVEVMGDSMEPTIRKGAIVGVVPLQGDLVEGGIYLVHRRHFGLQVKRVRADATGGLVLYSDNPAYEPQPISIEEDINALIIGQIIWCWQEI